MYRLAYFSGNRASFLGCGEFVLLTESQFRAFLKGCPAGSADRLSAISAIFDSWLPWAEQHLPVFAELADVNASSAEFDAFLPSYALLSVHYMLHDAAIDESETDRSLILASSDALVLFIWSFETKVLPLMNSTPSIDPRARIVERLAERNTSLVIERDRKTTWVLPGEPDRTAAIGRSNSTQLAYELLCCYKGQPADREVLEAIGQLVYLMQLGDDLGDWVDDYQTGNRTMFLRWCADRVGIEATRSLPELEKAIYLTGYYESYVSQLVCDFDALRDDFSKMTNHQTRHAVKYIDNARAMALSLLQAAVATKLTFIDDIG